MQDLSVYSCIGRVDEDEKISLFYGIHFTFVISYVNVGFVEPEGEK